MEISALNFRITTRMETKIYLNSELVLSGDKLLLWLNCS